MREIADKLAAGERLSFDDGVALFRHPDLHAVGRLANQAREARHGAVTYYNYNLRLEATNVCEASCMFCSFARIRPTDAQAYTLSLEQVFDKLRDAVACNLMLCPVATRRGVDEEGREFDYEVSLDPGAMTDAQIVEAYETALKAANVRYTKYMYENVNHAFHNDTGAARYDKAAAELSWQRTVEFLKKELA